MMHINKDFFTCREIVQTEKLRALQRWVQGKILFPTEHSTTANTQLVGERSIENSFKKLVILMTYCALKLPVPCAQKDILESIL